MLKIVIQIYIIILKSLIFRALNSDQYELIVPDNQPLKNIVILASGNGTNAEAILEYFSDSSKIQISHIISNNPTAGVLKRAKNHQVKASVFNREDFYRSDRVHRFLKELAPDLIVLAGFLWMIPANILHSFPNQIINIHPALLPKYGGEGMYGNHVHRAVLQHKEKETGITIHYVNEHYDQGEIIAQFTTPIALDETLESLLPKIRKLEHYNYPRVIQNILCAAQ